MDAYEATKTVMSRIQILDPENAAKIMGCILIQDQGEKEMIRLALGPETHLVSVMNQAKALLGLPSSTPPALSATSPSAQFNPSRPTPFLQGSPRIIVTNNGFHANPPSPPSPWSVAGFSDYRSPGSHTSPRQPSPLSYAAVVNGASSIRGDLREEYGNDLRLHERIPFGEDSKGFDFTESMMSPGGRSDSVLFPSGISGEFDYPNRVHRRSYSVSDAFMEGGNEFDDGGFGFWPCMYYARGFCKNGSNCKFVHGGFNEDALAMVGSPGNVDGFEDVLRLKALQHQRFAAMAGGAPFPYGSRSVNFLGENQRSALMMGEDFPKFGRSPPERNDFAAFGYGGIANSSARQIYLTFPADSTFKEEDVSNYFSMFGPVQDVRIPYQQKRMFGFVTFVYPETVKQILAKGNPHFVCDSRVLVKPYKEKGKFLDKKQQQQMERGEFSGCLSPSGLELAEPFDHIPYGARMFQNTQEMMRKKLEERAELQQAIEYQSRRMTNIQLSDINDRHQSSSGGISVSLPTQSHYEIRQSLLLPTDAVYVGTYGESNGSQDNEFHPKRQNDIREVCDGDDNNGAGRGKEERSNLNNDLNESLELILPDNLFSSPTKSASNDRSVFNNELSEADDEILITTESSSPDNVPIQLTTSTAINKSSVNLRYLQMSRFSSGQEAIDM